VILAGGDVYLPRNMDVQNCLIRAAGKVKSEGQRAGLKGSELKENDPRALSCVRFFQTKDVGLEVAADKAGLRASAVDPDLAFAKAGLKAGDVLVSFDGKDLDKADAFRRHLRRKVAEGGEVELRVRRDGKPLTLAVRFD
jgi:S1-C subfamily serine protease